jgi:hypothetical protein
MNASVISIGQLKIEGLASSPNSKRERQEAMPSAKRLGVETVGIGALTPREHGRSYEHGR